MDPNPFRRRAFHWPWRSRSQVRRDVDDELRFHLEMRAEELERSGLPPGQARREAVERFGDLEYTRRYCVAEGTRKEERVRRGILLEEFRQDVVIGCRRLWKARGVAGLALLTLALGIGANTAVFSLVNAALLRPLPYREPGRLVVYFEGIPQADLPKTGVSPPDFLDFARDQRTSEALAIFVNERVELAGEGTAERVTATRVSPVLFRLLGVGPALGRTFTDEEDRPGANLVVLSHPLWQRLFGGRTDAIGRTITLNRQAYMVVGVMPTTFAFPLAGLTINGRPGDLWIPFAMTEEEREGRASFFRNGVIGRLKAGVTIEQARAELPVLLDRTLAGYPVTVRGMLSKDGRRGLEGMVLPLRDELTGDIRTPLVVLLAAVGLVLLIACANVANLLASRAAAREREVVVMAALGASRGRLRRMLLTESLILALGGGLAGLAVAWAATIAAPLALPARLASLGDVSPDLRVLGFTLLASLGTALLSGLVPAATATRVDLQQALRSISRNATGNLGHRVWQHGLVVFTVALSTVLLVGAGLLVRSFSSLLRSDVGSRTDHVLTGTVTLPEKAYGTPESVRTFERGLLERVKALPDVTAASVSSDIPLGYTDRLAFTPEDSPLRRAEVPLSAVGSWPHGDFFRVHGIPLRRGRLFDTRDRQDGQRVAIVSDAFARHVWPGRDPIGQRLKWGIAASDSPWMTVVGVVGDVKEFALDAEAGLHVYEPWEQLDDAHLVRGFFRTVTVSLRTVSEPTSLTGPLRAAVRGMDPSLALSDVRSMDERVAEEAAPRRMSAALMTGFAGAALLMAVAGLYGVVAYAVAQRVREIGVRVALGARTSDIVGPLVRRGLALAALGLAIGLPCAVALGSLIGSILYRTRPHDAIALAGAAGLMGSVAALASYLPASRAARVDPVHALRVE